MNITECRFCQINHGNYSELYDQPIKRDRGYFSLTSVGAFVPGWSLIVPEIHAYSMRNEYSNPDFLVFANEWINHVRKTYNKKIMVFEHGANRCGSQTSCGTNHAHLHVVPYGKSLLDRMLNDREWINVRCDRIKETVGENEYLLYADVSERLDEATIYVHILEKEESQYFRKLLGEKVGVTDFSYKTAPHYNDTVETYKKLTGG